MKRLEIGMTRFVSRIPVIIVFGGMMVYTLVAAGFGIIEGISAGRGEEPMVDLPTYAVLLGAACVAYAIFLLFHKRLLRWLESRLAEPIVHRLVASADARRKALVLGAVLLTSGFVLQLMAALFVP